MVKIRLIQFIFWHKFSDNHIFVISVLNFLENVNIFTVCAAYLISKFGQESKQET